jgi:MFS family permease
VNLRGLAPQLPRRAWIVLGGDLVSAIGSGMTLPFFVVYLHRVRGIDLRIAGLALATIAIASFAGNLIGGSLADRFGPRRALVAGLLASTAGASWFAFVHSVPAAFGAAAVIGLGASVSWPTLDALLASTVEPRQRSAVFSLRHATFNAGLGIGTVAAAAIADFSSPGTFQLLYLSDAALFLAFIPVLLGLRGVGEAVPDPAPGGGGYRVVFADRAFVRVWLLTALLVTIGYAQYQASFAPFAIGTGGISAHALAIAFAVNTIGVTVFQLFALRLLQGRRRTTALALACLLIGASWGVTIAAGHAGSYTAAVVGFAAAMAIFAVGETLVSPSLGPLVNDLAPDRLRGRYNGVFTLSWTTGFAVGPAIAGVGLGIRGGTPFFVFLTALCLLGVAAAIRLRRSIPLEADLVGEAAPA